MNKIPTHVLKYLWDVNTEKLASKDSSFIIERVLEYGDEKALFWLNRTYEKKDIVDTLAKGKRISPKTGNFYALYYGVKKESILCIQRPFTQKQNRF